MERSLTTPKDSAEAYRLAVKEVGAKTLSQQTGASLTHIYRMAADPKFNGEIRNHTFEQAYRVAKEMTQKGLKEAVFVSISKIVYHLLKCKMVPLTSVPDKDTAFEEHIDMSQATADLAAIGNMYLTGKATKDQLHEAEYQAYREIGEFTAKVVQEKRQYN